MCFIVNFPLQFVNTPAFTTLNPFGPENRFYGNGCLSGVCYNLSVMTSRKKKKTERVIFDSIRKPTAPSSKKFGGDKREDKTDPVQRKVKHKKKQRETENDVDIS